MRKIDLSVQSYSFHDFKDAGKYDVFNFLNTCKYRYRLDNVDIWCRHLQSLDKDYIQKVREELDANDLTVANYCVDGPWVWCDDPDEREQHRLEMLEHIRAGIQMGVKTIRIDMGGPRDVGGVRATVLRTMTDEAFDYIVKTYKEYCKICGDNGIRIGPENHWGWDRVPEYLEKVRDAVDDPAYGHLYHIDNFFDEPERGEEICMSYAMHVHVTPGAAARRAKDVIRKLESKGYTGAYSAECGAGGPLLFQQLDLNLCSIREVIAELALEELPEPQYRDFFGDLLSGKQM